MEKILSSVAWLKCHLAVLNPGNTNQYNRLVFFDETHQATPGAIGATLKTTLNPGIVEPQMLA